MTETIEPARGVDDPFKLTVCPGCDYSLENLPEAGTCPECGRKYDQTHIVIVGHGRGRFDTTWRQYVGWVIALVILLWVIRSRLHLIFVVYLGFLGLYLAARFYVQMFSPRKRQAQLWLSREGIVQIESNSDAREAMTFVGRLFLHLSSCAIVVPLFMGRTWPEPWLVGVALVVVAYLNVIGFLQAKSTSPIISVDGMPRLNPWSRMEELEIDPCMGGRYRLMARINLRWWLSRGSARVVDIELPFDKSKVLALERQIAEWTGGQLRCPIVTPVPQEFHMAVIEAGSKAPTFKLPSSTGETIDLADYKGKQVVLYFYPRADTPGCTKEACGFRDAIASHKKLGVPVFGISPDPVKDVTAFAEKFKLNFPLLADEDHAITEKYGAWQEKSMYGKKYMGAARTTFIIGADGKIEHVFEKVKPEGHDQEVLEYLKGAAK